MVLEFLEEQGFTLPTERDTPTYIAPNGTSTIDLLFYKGKHIKIAEQKGLWYSSTTSLRKHIPTTTIISIPINNQEQGCRYN